MTFKARGVYASSSKEPRRFRVRSWLLLGAALAAALVLGTVVVVVGKVGVIHDSDTSSFSGPQAVEFDNGTNGDVTFTRGDGDEVRVERAMRGTPFSVPTESVEEDDGVLELEASCAGLPFFDCWIDYEITVPAGTDLTVETTIGRIVTEGVDGVLDLGSTVGSVRVSGNSGDVTIETGSGEIDVSGVEGSLEAETASGGITAHGAGEHLKVASVSGEVDVSGFSARTVVAESVSGGVRVGGGFTRAEVHTVSGGIEVTTGEPFELLNMESTSGDIDVRVPEGAYAVTDESVSGGRRVEVDTSPEADARIRAETVSGSMNVTYG
ncbi:DUF4097 family beta strand repeat-containing protein [Nocardiopsis halotolerans]|uniref:DUF4097 family beta strand repeat-containing protein n=1 Tax=Nocardiopsis halotolerans TaxID=124252 RepID=UPI000475C66D|nr:DUF4097 family beta strand repeat-containing protein [Nocardiopsis halotolerans]